MYKIKCFAILVLILMGVSCGNSKKSSKDKSPSFKPANVTLTKAEQAFADVSKTHEIPQRLLTAVGYVESGLSFEPAFYLYGADDSRTPATLPSAQTAFGVSTGNLGLAESTDGDILPSTHREQIAAYADWLKKNLPEGLPANPTTSEEWFEWIWQIALLHRPEGNLRREVRSLFVKELLQALNQGFAWVDPETKSVIHFPAQKPEISEQDLSHESLDLLGPSWAGSPQTGLARLVVPPMNQLPQLPQMPATPQGIEVIHCPLSLTACINLATSPDHKIQVHYIIPSSPEIMDAPLQTLYYKNQSMIIGAEGTSIPSSRIVMMLVGPSGRPQGSKRIGANPNWFTKWQLEKFSELVTEICYEISKAVDPVSNLSPSPEVSANKFRECATPGSGIIYHTTQPGAEPHWGDLPDFDPEIFNAYAQAGKTLEGETFLSVDKPELTYQKGAEISYHFSFSNQAKRVVMTEINTCTGERTYWVKVLNEPVRDLTSYDRTRRLFDAGAYQDGRHFYRLKVYGSHGALIGWDQLALKLENFESDTGPSDWICGG